VGTKRDAHTLVATSDDSCEMTQVLRRTRQRSPPKCTQNVLEVQHTPTCHVHVATTVCWCRLECPDRAHIQSQSWGELGVGWQPSLVGKRNNANASAVVDSNGSIGKPNNHPLIRRRGRPRKDSGDRSRRRRLQDMHRRLVSLSTKRLRGHPREAATDGQGRRK